MRNDNYLVYPNGFKTSGVLMKKLLLASLILGTTVAQAADLNVVDVYLPMATSFDTVDSSFQMNTSTGAGSVKVTVTQQRQDPFPHPYPGPCTPYGGCFPNPRPMPMPVVIFDEMIPVNGLRLENKKVLFDGENGTVDCGTLGYSRILKIPTIYLSGNCTLIETLGRNGNLRVTLRTK